MDTSGPPKIESTGALLVRTAATKEATSTDRLPVVIAPRLGAPPSPTERYMLVAGPVGTCVEDSPATTVRSALSEARTTGRHAKHP